MRKITLKIKNKQVVVFQLFRFYNEAKQKNHENVCDLNLFDRRGHRSFVCRGGVLELNRLVFVDDTSLYRTRLVHQNL